MPVEDEEQELPDLVCVAAVRGMLPEAQRILSEHHHSAVSRCRAQKGFLAPANEAPDGYWRITPLGQEWCREEFVL